MFSNLVAYQCESDVLVSDLQERLERYKFEELSELGVNTIGFSQPLGNDGQGLFELSHTGDALFLVRRDWRDVPPQLTKKEAKKRIAERYGADYEYTKDELHSVAEGVRDEFLKRAFVKSEVIKVLFLAKEKRLVIDTNNIKKAEQITQLFRELLGGLSNFPLNFATQEGLDRWVREPSWQPQRITLSGNCKLIDQEKGSAAFRGQDIESEEVQHFLNNGGFNVKMLSVEWQEKATFDLFENGQLKKLKFHMEMLDIDEIGEAAHDYMARFIVYSDLVRQIINDALVWTGKVKTDSGQVLA